MFSKSVSLAAAALLPLSGVAATAAPPYEIDASICQGEHCYVMAEKLQGDRHGPYHGVGATITEPHRLAVPFGESSIAQLDLDNDITTAIEFGWIVAPAIHGDLSPHLFAYLRAPGRVCSIGASKEDACKGDDWKLESPGARVPHLGDAVADGTGFYHIGYHPASRAWWIQYGGHWIASVPDKYWRGRFVNGKRVAWFGEVSADEGKPCIYMGNGRLGTAPNSASMTGMFYEYMGPGSKVAPARAWLLAPTKPEYWNSNRTAWTDRKKPPEVFSDFRFGGPGPKPSNCR